MSSPFNKFNNFVLDLANKKHNFDTDTYKFMLTNAEPDSALDSEKADVTEISAGNGYTAGGLTIGTSASQTGGTLSVAPSGDLTLTASGGSIGAFRYVVLYNDTTVGKPLVSYYDYGSSITLQDNETLTIDTDATLFTLS